MPVPQVPLLTEDIRENQELIVAFLSDLVAYIAEGEPEGVWSATVTAESRTSIAGVDSLLQTQNVLGTLIDTLQGKGTLG